MVSWQGGSTVVLSPGRWLITFNVLGALFPSEFRAAARRVLTGRGHRLINAYTLPGPVGLGYNRAVVVVELRHGESKSELIGALRSAIEPLVAITWSWGVRRGGGIERVDLTPIYVGVGLVGLILFVALARR